MPLVKYKTTGGKILTFTGSEAYNVALEEVCRDRFGEPFSSFQNKLAGATIIADGMKCFFVVLGKITTLEAARSAADLGNVSQQLAARTEKYGFKTCPECNAVHTRKVKDCRRCGHEAEIPPEADEEIRQYIKRPLPEVDEEGAEDTLHDDRLLALDPDDEPQKVAARRSMKLRELEDKAYDGSITPDEAKDLLTIQREDVLGKSDEVIDTDAPPKEILYMTGKPAEPDSMDAMIQESEEEEDKKEKIENGEKHAEQKEEAIESQGEPK